MDNCIGFARKVDNVWYKCIPAHERMIGIHKVSAFARGFEFFFADNFVPKLDFGIKVSKRQHDYSISNKLAYFPKNVFVNILKLFVYNSSFARYARKLIIKFILVVKDFLFLHCFSFCL